MTSYSSTLFDHQNDLQKIHKRSTNNSKHFINLQIEFQEDSSSIEEIEKKRFYSFEAEKFRKVGHDFCPRPSEVVLISLADEV